MADACFFTLRPLKLGAEVFGIDLKNPVGKATIEKIKRNVAENRLLVFRGQGIVDGNRQVEIAKWFGEIDSTPFYKHPKSPSKDVFRVSNDETEGCLNVGRTGWHIDGSFQAFPYSHSIYHMVSIPKFGDTRFVGLRDVIESLPNEQRRKWERLWMISDRRNPMPRPLIYSHPLTELPTMCFHLGMIGCFAYDFGSSDYRMTNRSETLELIDEIHSAITKNNEALIYSHKWEAGDFIISDNLAVGHEASPETQYPVEKVGLRILHRVTVAGRHLPKKF